MWEVITPHVYHQLACVGVMAALWVEDVTNFPVDSREKLPSIHPAEILEKSSATHEHHPVTPAKAIGVDPPRVHSIVNEERGISP